MRRVRKVLVIVAIVAAVPLLPVAKSEADRLTATRSLSQSAPVCRVDTEARMIALTFDDGPDPSFTPAVLDFLRANEAKATFFIVGTQAEMHPDLVQRIKAEGHEIANHTWNHARLKDLDSLRAREDAMRTNGVLQNTATATLYRAPLGEINKEQIAAVETLGLQPVHWSLAVDNLVGGRGLSPEAAAAQLVAQAENGEIILAHDVPGSRRAEAFEALRIAIPELKQQGFSITDASTVLASGTPVRSKPRTGFWQNGFACPG